METKVSLIIQSHLSDVLESNDLKDIANRVGFVKYLVALYPNTTDKIDADEAYNRYQSKKDNPTW